MTAIDEAREWLARQDDVVGTISTGLVRELLQELQQSQGMPVVPQSEMDKQIPPHVRQYDRDTAWEGGGESQAWFESSGDSGQLPQTAPSEHQVSAIYDEALDALAEDAEDMGAYESASPHNAQSNVIVPATLIWQAVFNPPEGMENYEAYRIEYGGHAMDCLIEGVIWLPPGVDPETIERAINGGNHET